MKVFGQLESAQLENATPGTLTHPNTTGRVYTDVTNASAAVPKFYNGSTWLQFLLAQSTALISANGGTAITIDWSKGLYQQVVLTGHCVISFTNPQAGSVHVLVVTQQELYNASVLKTPYRFVLNMIDQDPRRGPYQPQGVIQSGESQVFSWFYAAGIKAGYASLPAKAAGNPVTVAAGAILQSDISPDGQTFGAGGNTSPFQTFHNIEDGGGQLYWGLTATPFSATSLPGQSTQGVVYSPDRSLFYALTATPFLSGRATYGNYGVTTYADPGILPAGASKCIAMHPSGMAVGVGHATTPFMSFYPLLPQAFGTKYANPVTLPAAQVNAAAFSQTGEYLAVGTQTTPFIQVYAFDYINGFTGSSSNPGALPAGGPAAGFGKNIAWRPQGDFIAMTMSVSPYIYVVPFNRATGVFGTALTISFVTGPTAAPTSVQFTPDGQYLLVGGSTGAFFWCYDFSAGTVPSTPVATDLGTPVGIAVNDITLHPSGEFAVLSVNTTPFVYLQPLPRKVRNYLRINM